MSISMSDQDLIVMAAEKLVMDAISVTDTIDFNFIKPVAESVKESDMG